MSDIFALKGRGNSGKTETVKLVYDELVRKYPAANVNNLSPNTNDITIILTNVKGHTVGIESQGDPKSRLRQSLQSFLNAGCDIIICATRTSGMTVDWVNFYSGQHRVHFVEQVYASPSTQQANNIRMAQNIIAQAGL